MNIPEWAEKLVRIELAINDSVETPGTEAAALDLAWNSAQDGEGGTGAVAVACALDTVHVDLQVLNTTSVRLAVALERIADALEAK